MLAYPFYALLCIFFIFVFFFKIIYLKFAKNYVIYFNPNTFPQHYYTFPIILKHYYERSKCFGFLANYAFFSKLKKKTPSLNNYIFSRIFNLPFWVLVGVVDLTAIFINATHNFDRTKKKPCQVYFFTVRREITRFILFTHNHMYEIASSLKIYKVNGKINFNPLSDTLVREVYFRFMLIRLQDYLPMNYNQLLGLYSAVIFRGSPHLGTAFNFNLQAAHKEEVSTISHFSHSQVLKFFNGRELIGQSYSPTLADSQSYNFNSIVPNGIIRQQNLSIILMSMGVINRYRLLNMMAFQYMRGFVNIENQYVRMNRGDRWHLMTVEEAISHKQLRTNILNQQLEMSEIDRNLLASLITEVASESGEIIGLNSSSELPYSTLSNVISRFGSISSSDHNELYLQAYAELTGWDHFSLMLKYNNSML